MKKDRLDTKPKCSNCGSELDWFTAIADDARPRDGDIGVCAYCSIVGQYANGLTELKEMSEKELAELKKEEPELWGQLEKGKMIAMKMMEWRDRRSDGTMSDGTDIEITRRRK